MRNLIKNNIDKFYYFKDEDDKGYDAFIDMWNNSQNSILKFETLQFYNVDEPSYDCLINNDYDGLINDLVSYWNKEKKELYKKVYDREIDFYRLHIIEEPITDYLISEFYSYIASEKIGEKIKTINKNEVSDSKYELLDFLVFDDYGLMITVFDKTCKPLGDWITYDKELVKEIKNLFFNIYKDAKDFHYMYNGNDYIKQKILNGLNE